MKGKKEGALMKKMFWLFPLFLLFAACGTPTPSATALPTPTGFLSPTFTPTPNRTQLWQATLAVNQTQNAGYNATQGARHTQVAQTQAVKALTPTITPTPTTTPFPTFGPSTPLSGAEMYQLVGESAQRAMERLPKLEAYWEKILEDADGFWDALNPLKFHLARLTQEVLWRNPGLSTREALEWQIAKNLAFAGEQEATEYLQRLLVQELNRNAALSAKGVESISIPGFELTWFSAPNLFGDGRAAWVVQVMLADAGWNYTWGGTVLAVREFENGLYSVMPVNSSWQPYFGDGFEVMVEDHTADEIPEILIHRGQQHGMGDNMREYWVCVYQWEDPIWSPLLWNARGEPYLYKTDWMPSDCLITYNYLRVEYLMVESSSTELLQASKNTDSIGCGWEVHFEFIWNGKNYEQKVFADIPTNPAVMYGYHCITDVLRNWGDMLGNYPEILNTLEIILSNWPDPTMMLPSDTTFSAFYGPDFRDEFRFQLARLYALSGDLEKATEYFSQVIDHPDDPTSREWPALAQRYLNQLEDVATAEAELTNDLFPPQESAPTALLAGDIADQAALALFQNGDVETIIESLEIAVNDPDLSAIREYPCSDLYADNDQPVSILYHQVNECAAVYYWLAVAYEVRGNEEKAVEFYWYVWQNYPDSFYALVAEDRLVERP